MRGLFATRATERADIHPVWGGPRTPDEDRNKRRDSVTSYQRAPDREDDSSGTFTVAMAVYGAEEELLCWPLGMWGKCHWFDWERSVLVGDRHNSSSGNTKRSGSRLIQNQSKESVIFRTDQTCFKTHPAYLCGRALNTD